MKEGFWNHVQCFYWVYILNSNLTNYQAYVKANIMIVFFPKKLTFFLTWCWFNTCL